MTGLATFTRAEVKRKLLENADLRPMLDVEPYLRDILRAFYENRFKEGLVLLEKHSVSLTRSPPSCTPLTNRSQARQLLDIHLQSHVPRLMHLIRSRALLVYFSPYSSVSINRMATAFGWTDAELRASVIDLIKSGDFKARIDNQAAVLVARKKDVRGEAFKRALEEGEKIQRRAVASELRCVACLAIRCGHPLWPSLLLAYFATGRMRLIKAEVVVKGPKGQQEAY